MAKLTQAQSKSSWTVRWLVNRNFAWLWIGQSISQIGDWFFRMTLYLWILQRLASGQPWAPLAIGGVTLATILPSLIIGPLAGVFVDRWDRRQTMIWMDVIRAGLIALLLAVALLVPSTTWRLVSIFVVLILVSVCSQFFDPARVAIVAQIVPVPERPKSTALLFQAYFLATIFGPAIATPLYFAFGPAWALALDALSFLVSVLAILAMRVPGQLAESSTAAPQKSSFRREFVAGLRFFFENRVLKAMLTCNVLFYLGAAGFNAISILFVVQNLHTFNNLTGLFEPAYGLGAVVGLPLATMLVKRSGEGRLLWTSIVVFSIFLLALSRMTMVPQGLAGFFLLGLTNAGIVVTGRPIIMLATPNEFLGRVYAVLGPGITVASLLGAALASSLTSALQHFHTAFLGMAFGPIDTIFTGVAIMMLITGLYVLVALDGVRTSKEESSAPTSSGH